MYANTAAASPELISYFLSSTSLAYARALFFYSTLVPILNILLEFYPLYRGKDNVDDIPLTPSQRALFGLDPYATPPPAPGSTYITPPRYSRSPTPRNSSPASGSQRSRDSPYSRRESPFSSSWNESASSLWGKQGFESTFSINASPLLHKAIGNGNRRQSYGSLSSLGLGADRVTGMESSLVGPATPSPSTGRGGASVGLNNRWLYERGRIGSGRKLG